MSKLKRNLLILTLLLILGVITTFIIMSDPAPDFRKTVITMADQFSVDSIQSKHHQQGMLKSVVSLSMNASASDSILFYGQDIRLDGNEALDRILIGVTNRLISRIELWNRDQLIEEKELGFMKKMTSGKCYELAVDIRDHTNKKYPGKSMITLRYYKGSGFFGDVGTIQMDLSAFGDITGRKTISFFAKGLDQDKQLQAEFSNLRIWKNYSSFD